MAARRIIVFAAYFPPHLGGYELSLYQLLTGMAKSGYEITVVTCNTEHALAMERADGFLIHRLPSWALLGGTFSIPKPTWSTFKLLRRLSRANYELVQTNTRFFVTSLLGLIFSRLGDIPLVHVELGSRHTVVASPVIDMVSKAYDHTMGALIAKSARKVICSSGAAEEFLRHLGVKGPITVLPTAGVDMELFSETRRATAGPRKTEMGLDGSLLVTVVCRLIYAKGVQDLLAALPGIKEKAPNVKVLVVGDGPYRSRLEEIARQIDPGAVRFLGQLEHREVAAIMAMTDVLVHPSYSEALVALPILEAGSMGVPSVTTDAGGVREVIEAGSAGVVVPAGNIDDLTDGVVRLLLDRPLRQEIGKRIQQVVAEKYSLDRVVSAFMTELESVH
jgi:glycogen(starch) synthase